MFTTILLLAAVTGYLLGSLPFGYVVARARGVNIFEVGSKNPGATNVRRVLGRGPGNLVFALDALKGALAVALPVAYFWTRHEVIESVTPLDSGKVLLTVNWAEGAAICGLVGALLGHSFSCFTGFRGGKGVATGAGGFAVLFPVGALIALAVWLLAAVISRYVSVASMLAAISLPVSAFLLHRSGVLVVASALIALLVLVRHRTNLARLVAGTEHKIGHKPAAPKS
ncbi:MAG TPA: glycerol-3-phosphate 1-O-acyltransferase PlsY [Opitutaceae bacterium]|nr:glycerol-3-phosphate 1-O-acyltransferase PlsY [Opitutaceae bacterium]